MKKIILALGIFTLIGTASAANNIWPRVYHFGNHVRVEIWNHTSVLQTCSGWVNIEHRDRRFDTYHFNETVYPHMNLSRQLFPRHNQPITRVSHSIYCRPF